MPEALVTEQVSVARGPRPIVHSASLRAEYGSVTAIIGPNGAGKSTLLKALAGLLPYSGSVRVAGREVRSLEPRERAQLAAYVPQQSLLISNVSVRAVVAQGRFAHNKGFTRAAERDGERVQRALQDAQVSHLAGRAFNRLSGGEQRRVLLARALATEARVLLLDEPTAGLDIASVLRFHLLIRALAGRGLAVISVLHDLLDVYHYADYALLLAGGTLAHGGPAREVVTSSAIARAYGVSMVKDAVPPFRLIEEAP